MRLSIAAAVSFFLLPASAFANPVWTSRLSITAVQGPHVHIQCIYDPAFGGSAPEVTTFFGTSHSDWKDGPDTSADTGSGYRSLKTKDMCDCHVPTGVELTYKYTYSSFPVTVSADLDQPTTTGTCAAECAQADLRDAAMPLDAETEPDSPITDDTGGAQGMDGATVPAGSGGAPGTGGTTGSAGGAASKGGGFCAIASPARPMALPILCLLAGIALAVRRRRGA